LKFFVQPPKERVDRPTIATEVIQKLDVVTEKPAITEADKLSADLRMGPTVRKAMALPYSKISARFGGKPVTQAEAGNLKTVKASIDLVHKKANA